MKCLLLNNEQDWTFFKYKILNLMAQNYYWSLFNFHKENLGFWLQILRPLIFMFGHSIPQDLFQVVIQRP